jgi:N2-citryl-N6-acetyl-N6-hydroxylysine synthase/acetyl CoA:N6-hydroxylysine acetyl transferase
MRLFPEFTQDYESRLFAEPAPVRTAWPPLSPVQSSLYREVTPALGHSIALRLMDLERDFETFFEWQHQPRVARYWGLDQSPSELRDYMKRSLGNPNELPMILEFDGEAAGYVEAYWARHERISNHYDADLFDRGFHILIGNKNCLGVLKTEAVLKAVCTFLFLREPRTTRLIADPRVDNRAILKYLERIPAWRMQREFEDEGQRYALLECRREDFFRT